MIEAELPPPPPGDPAALQTAAGELRTLRRGFSELAPYVRGTAERLYGQAWRGEASVAFLEHCNHIHWIMDQAGDRAEAYARVCDRWAGELAAAQRRYQAASLEFDQGLDMYYRSHLTDPAQAGPLRDQAVETVLAAVAEARAAVGDAELAEQDAAGGFAAITPPAFGAMTDRLSEPLPGWAYAAEGLGVVADATGTTAEVAPHLDLAWEGSRLGWVSTVTGGYSAAAERYGEDAGNPLLNAEDRRRRMWQDGVVRGTTSWGGGALGSAGGAAVAGPPGAAGGAYLGGEAGDRAGEWVLDTVRGERGVPLGHSILPGPNLVVEPLPAIDEPAADGPVVARDAYLYHDPPPGDGYQPDRPPHLERPSPADAAETIRQGVPEPVPPPSSVLPPTAGPEAGR